MWCGYIWHSWCFVRSDLNCSSFLLSSLVNESFGFALVSLRIETSRCSFFNLQSMKIVSHIDRKWCIYDTLNPSKTNVLFSFVSIQKTVHRNNSPNTNSTRINKRIAWIQTDTKGEVTLKKKKSVCVFHFVNHSVVRMCVKQLLHEQKTAAKNSDDGDDLAWNYKRKETKKKRKRKIKRILE